MMRSGKGEEGSIPRSNFKYHIGAMAGLGVTAAE